MSRKENTAETARKYHTETFENISEEKKERILRAAAAEFAVRGFERARVSDIAKAAGVSHGSIFSYFETKDDILSYLIEEINEVQDMGFEVDGDSAVSFESALRKLIERSFHMARQRPFLMSVWLSLSFAYNSKFAAQVKDIERTGIENWHRLLKRAAEKGEISAETDLRASAYIIDSVLANILRGYISDHEKKKLEFHFGSGTALNDIIDRVAGSLLKLLG